MQSQSQQGLSLSMDVDQVANNEESCRSTAQQPVHSSGGPTFEGELAQAWDKIYQCLMRATDISKMSATMKARVFALFERYMKKYGPAFEIHAGIWSNEVRNCQEEFRLINYIYTQSIERVEEENRLAMLKIIYESRLKAQRAICKEELEMFAIIESSLNGKGRKSETSAFQLNATSTSRRQFRQ